MMAYEVICIDDKNRPNEIPAERWIKEGETYTLVRVDRSHINGPIAIIEEIDISDCWPYSGFALKRFALPKDVPKKELELEEVI